jgi:recombination protein RecA
VSEIDALISRVNKRLKSEVLVYANRLVTYQRVTTGSLSFDLMLGGGWPLNCWNEIVGMESSGKTALTLKTIGRNQAEREDYTTLWVASEEYNKQWASDLGVDNDRVVLATTNVMEDAYQIVIDALDSQAFDAIIIDSYPALIPSVEDEQVMDDWTVGLGARLTNKLMRKSPRVQRRVPGERNCLAIIINQWRDKIGVQYGDPRTTPGGKGKNFSFFTRVEVSRDEWITNSARTRVGQVIKARTIKNKTAPPAQVATVSFYFDDSPPFVKGDYDSLQETWSIATTYDIIERKGSYYHFEGRKWQGKDPVLQSMREDPVLRDRVETHVRHYVLGAPLPEAPRKTRRVPRK